MVCSVCGRSSSEPGDALTWSLDVERGERHWTCVDCVRTHVRSVEGKLDRTYWTFD